MAGAIRIALLLAVAGTDSLAAGAPPSPARPRLPTKAQLSQCPALAQIDWKAVRKLSSLDPPADRWSEHRRIRGPRPLPDLSRAEIVLDVAIGSGETQEYPTSTSSIVWREPGGAWQLSRVDYVIASPEPPPPGSPPRKTNGGSSTSAR